MKWEFIVWNYIFPGWQFAHNFSNQSNCSKNYPLLESKRNLGIKIWRILLQLFDHRSCIHFFFFFFLHWNFIRNEIFRWNFRKWIYRKISNIAISSEIIIEPTRDQEPGVLPLNNFQLVRFRVVCIRHASGNLFRSFSPLLSLPSSDKSTVLKRLSLAHAAANHFAKRPNYRRHSNNSTRVRIKNMIKPVELFLGQ